ncbi:hypothetical protein N9Y83_00385 [Flavobacteriaceae bacterium]|nr:hypothetical protein [Flavobacteriaceae bacterium]
MKKMKKTNVLLVFIVSLALLSCFEDNVDFSSALQTDNQFPTPDAEFTINGTDYSISNGYMTSPDEGTNGSNYKIILLNGALKFRSYRGFPCCYISGTNQSVIFNITSTSATELAEGTYPFELTTTGPSLNGVRISTNMVVPRTWAVESEDVIPENQINSGSLTIQKLDDFFAVGDLQFDKYTLTYSFETLNSGTVIGSFVGVLKPVQDNSD